MRERHPWGVRKYTRDQKALVRRKDVFAASDLDRAMDAARERLVVIDTLLTQEVNPNILAELAFERAWLRFASYEINTQDRLREVSKLLNTQPDSVVQYLDQVMPDGQTRMEIIRNRIIDPLSGRIRIRK